MKPVRLVQKHSTFAKAKSEDLWNKSTQDSVSEWNVIDLQYHMSSSSILQPSDIIKKLLNDSGFTC